MHPLLTTQDGAEWETKGNIESLFVQKHGLAQLDYIFGVSCADYYDWKTKTLALHSRCEIESIRFSFYINSSILQVSARHTLIQ